MFSKEEIYMKRQFVLITAFVLSLTFSSSALAQKFHADDPLLKDNDKAVVVTEITKHKLNDQYDLFQHSFLKPGDRRKAPAMNVNTMGEVPDSSWFQNRHGVNRMSLADLANGPNTTDGPSTEQPWIVIAPKT